MVYKVIRASLTAQLVKNPSSVQETLVIPEEGIGYPLQYA